MPFIVVRDDITKMKVDAIVNAANNNLQMGSGVCGAIFVAAGKDELRAACNKLAPLETGTATITPGFNLSAKYIIHTVGPIYQASQDKKCEFLLQQAYLNSLELAVVNNCESVAFPVLSGGNYGYPKDKALKVAKITIESFLDKTKNDLTVYLVVYDQETYLISKKLLKSVKNYIKENYVAENISDDSPQSYCFEKRISDCSLDSLSRPLESPVITAAKETTKKSKQNNSLLEFDLDESFSDTLLGIIDSQGKSDVAVYKRANIDRKLFSKIRTGKGYTPSKRTAIALAIALELNLQQANELLKKAGYALSHSQKFDVIIEYFIKNNRYNIYEINEVLFSYDQPLLGG